MTRPKEAGAPAGYLPIYQLCLPGSDGKSPDMGHFGYSGRIPFTTRGSRCSPAGPVGSSGLARPSGFSPDLIFVPGSQVLGSQPTQASEAPATPTGVRPGAEDHTGLSRALSHPHCLLPEKLSLPDLPLLTCPSHIQLHSLHSHLPPVLAFLIHCLRVVFVRLASP